MDATVEPPKLIEDTTTAPCPHCEEPVPETAAISTHLFRESICRCDRCSTRFFWEAGEIVTEESVPQDGEVELAHAVEMEMQQTLATRWALVDRVTVRRYLNGLTRRLVSHLPGAPEAPRVTLCDDPGWWALAMPSGTVLLSTGLLASLEDEAEFAFVLAHEFAHAASRDVAMKMVRLGVDSLSKNDGQDAEKGWLDAAEDMIALGFGREREHAADEVAFRVTAECGYDLRSVDRFLDRVTDRVRVQDPVVTRYAVAHPSSKERKRRLDSFRHRQPISDAGRINREPFRRIAVAATRDPSWESVDELRGVESRPAGR
ncbi:MAG: M48 family metallopeptidase, partial [Acidobacteriota bacterium]|nr:M48 family metallopeptidase [Acidobacteriota bacterium]